MDNLTFKKISDKEFTINGSIQLYKDVSKTIVIDGETYINSKMELVNVNVNDLGRYHWTYYDLDFSFINKSYRVHNYEGFSYQTLIHKYSKSFLSENNKVAAYQLLFNEKVLDKRIRNIYTSNKKEISKYYFRQHFDVNRIPIFLHSYGFNNSVYCEMKLIDFLSIENKKLLHGYNEYKEYFLINYDVNIDEELNFKMAEKFILKAIRNKKKKLN